MMVEFERYSYAMEAFVNDNDAMTLHKHWPTSKLQRT
jgi:hypothetical protein